MQAGRLCVSVCVSQFRECCGLDCNVPHRSYFKCLFCSWWSYSVRPWNLLEVCCWMWAFERVLVQALVLAFLFLLAGLLCFEKHPRQDLADFLSTGKLSEALWSCEPKWLFSQDLSFCHSGAEVINTERDFKSFKILMTHKSTAKSPGWSRTVQHWVSLTSWIFFSW